MPNIHSYCSSLPLTVSYITLLCAITNWLRFFKAWQRTPEQWHIDLHDKHGDIVRLGPNCLSFGNPKAIKIIYALGKGFTKVFSISNSTFPAPY